MLELNPIAAVRNNAIGTWALAQAAVRHGTSKLVLISTDKAVKPHSVMGVSKRIAELAVVALSGTACQMSAIRLGNVIGSGGSVVPVFLKQIAEGTPLTVTHPDASRWFLRCVTLSKRFLLVELPRAKEESFCRSSASPYGSPSWLISHPRRRQGNPDPVYRPSSRRQAHRGTTLRERKEGWVRRGSS